MITMNPIVLRRGIPAIAKIGNAQKGCSMFATDSPIATDIVVAALDALRSRATGTAKGPTSRLIHPRNSSGLAVRPTWRRGDRYR